MTFIIGGGFAEVQMFIKVELTLSLELFLDIWIIFYIHTDIDKLQPKVLPNIIVHIICSRLCRSQIHIHAFLSNCCVKQKHLCSLKD